MLKVEDNYDVKEVIEAIRLFVENFFTCKECVENFLKETTERSKFLNKPNDAVEYLWKGDTKTLDISLLKIRLK